MAQTLATRPRKERSVMGTACAACEEPLEHMLRGERVLTLTCGHVSHEACFYEYIKDFESQQCPLCGASLSVDPSRGANIDMEKLNNLVKARPSTLTPQHTPDLRTNSAVGTPEQRGGEYTYRASPQAPSHWDNDYRPQPPSAAARSIHSSSNSPAMYQGERDSRAYSVSRLQRPSQDFSQGSDRQHARMDSGNTGRETQVSNGHSPADFTQDRAHSLARKHDYDVQSMETSASPRMHSRNPIPAPTVTIRSEFPSITRSKQTQSLACLVTVEVPDVNWSADPRDIRNAPHTPSPSVVENFKAHPPQMPPAHTLTAADYVRDPPDVLQRIQEDLYRRVENWHGLEYTKFGKLLLYGPIRVGKDRHTWQELDCYLFEEMLICVKERTGRATSPVVDARLTLKGSILIKKHLITVEATQGPPVLTLSLTVDDLPYFHLYFTETDELSIWQKALSHINASMSREDGMNRRVSVYDDIDDDARTNNTMTATARNSSIHSSSGATRSNITSPTECSNQYADFHTRPATSIHVPIDLVIVIPISSSMQGLKISLLRDILRFLVAGLGDNDRMGLVTFGAGAGGGMPIVGMASKAWPGWSKVFDSIKPSGQKSLRADVVEGANVAVDLLMQRKTSNPLSSIMLISDSATTDNESVDFVVSRAEAAKITISSFGLGLTHRPDTMIELSTRTKATYTYVKDWMMLRECVAGCLGALQSTSHQNVKLKLRLPEGSNARFVKVSGALQVIKRATGRDAEVSLGDLRFGDKRDVLVQLAIAPDTNESAEVTNGDPWAAIVSGLEALGGPMDSDDARASVEEVPLVQADLVWGDILREGSASHLPRPSLLAITMLPATLKSSGASPAAMGIPPHPGVVQRRMEVLTSDMLTRALTLVSRSQADRANHLLAETRMILKGLGKGGLPSAPTPPSATTPVSPPPTSRLPPTPNSNGVAETSSTSETASPMAASAMNDTQRTYSPVPTTSDHGVYTPGAGIDPMAISALDAEVESALEWISHPAVFTRDSRKAVLQAIGVINSQRSCTFRTPAESLWAGRVPGVRRLNEVSKHWREIGDDLLTEEA